MNPHSPAVRTACRRAMRQSNPPLGRDFRKAVRALAAFQPVLPKDCAVTLAYLLWYAEPPPQLQFPGLGPSLATNVRRWARQSRLSPSKRRCLGKLAQLLHASSDVETLALWLDAWLLQHARPGAALEDFFQLE